MTIEERLKEQRNTSGLTQEELANRLNVTRQTISNWENGKRLPDIIMMNKIAKEYGITLDELCGDVTENKITYPKASGRLSLMSCFTIILYFIVGIATDNFRGEIALLMIITGIMMQVFIHLYFRNAVISQSFTGIAGYDPKVEYNIPELKATLIRLDTHLSCISTGSVLMYFASAFLPDKLDYMPVIILGIYILDYIAACLFISYSGAAQYLVNEHDRQASKAGMISTIWYITIILLSCGTAVEQVITHKMTNNSTESLIWCGWLFLLLIIASIGLFLEQKRAKKLAGIYRPGKSFIVITVICIAILIAML